jgi:LysM repeat protein
MARDYSTNRYKDKIKKLQQQKRTAADKRKSVKDLKREVSSNKKITSNNRKNKANEAFGKRVDKILDLFKPKKRAKPGVRSGIKTGTTTKTTSRITKPMAFADATKAKIKAKEESLSHETPRTYRSKKVGTPGMGVRSGVQTGKKPGAGGSYVYDRQGKKWESPKAKSRATPGTPGMGTRAGPKTGGRKAKTLTEAQKKAIRDTKQVTVKSGDTLTAIAKRNGTTVANLKKINPQIKDLNKIKPGQKIRVGGSDAYEKRIGQVSKSPDKPRTIAQAQKMGKKYFYDKNGKRKAAVTAEQLKKSGLTLSQWLKKK